MNTFALAILSVAISVMAQFALKAGMSSPGVRDVMSQPFAISTAYALLTNGFLLIGFCLYGLGAVVWLGVLSKWDVSKAYPLVGLGFALTVGIGLLAGEQVTPLRACGVMLICIGVFLVSRS